MDFSVQSGNEETFNALEDTHLTKNEKARISKSKVKAMMIVVFFFLNQRRNHD
jgi:hypothetical protein